MQVQPERSLSWPPLLAFFIALVLLLGAAAIAFGAVSVARDARPDAAASSPLKTRRCPECGWIESRRDLPAGTDNRAVTLPEYTVRMVDGSSRVFIAGPGERWRLGERLRYIEWQGSTAN
jgi:hypothetical protein